MCFKLEILGLLACFYETYLVNAFSNIKQSNEVPSNMVYNTGLFFLIMH